MDWRSQLEKTKKDVGIIIGEIVVDIYENALAQSTIPHIRLHLASSADYNRQDINKTTYGRYVLSQINNSEDAHLMEDRY